MEDLSDLALIFPTVERSLLGELLAFNGGDVERTAAAILDVGFPSGQASDLDDSSMAAQEALDAALARQTQQQFDEEFIAAQEGAAQEGAANATMPSPSGRQDPVSASGTAAAKGKRVNLKLVALKRKSKGAKKEGQRNSLLPQGADPNPPLATAYPSILSRTRGLFVLGYIGQSDQSDAPGSPAAGADSFPSPPVHQSRLRRAPDTANSARDASDSALAAGSHTAALLCSSPGSLAPPPARRWRRRRRGPARPAAGRASPRSSTRRASAARARRTAPRRPRGSARGRRVEAARKVESATQA